MKRYEFERYGKNKISYRFAIIDTKLGHHTKIATVYDIHDAEMICNALNERVANEHNNHL